MAPKLSYIFPPKPTFTEANLPSLSGRVYIITGSASGVGFELARILYAAGAKVYIAARSMERCNSAIEQMKEVTKGSAVGKLEAMVVDLADMTTVKPAVQDFLQKEERLDVLVHNAGVMRPPKGSKDKLGNDLEMGVHCLAPYLLTLLLEPVLKRTAAIMPANSVRIVWVVSILQVAAPAGGVSFDTQGVPEVLPDQMANYMQSKVGGAWLAMEFANRLGENGILSVSVHPGLLKTELQRYLGAINRAIIGLVFKPPIYGAYSELYAGFSPELVSKHNGSYLMAWGRLSEMPVEVEKGLKSQKNGGNGKAEKFVAYCSRITTRYV